MSTKEFDGTRIPRHRGCAGRHLRFGTIDRVPWGVIPNPYDMMRSRSMCLDSLGWITRGGAEKCKSWLFC